MKKGIYDLAAIPRFTGTIPEIQTIGWMPDHVYFHNNSRIRPLFLCFVLREDRGTKTTIVNGRRWSSRGGTPYVSLVPPGTVLTTVSTLRRDELFFIYRPETLPFWRNYLPDNPEPFPQTQRFQRLLDDLFENLNDLHFPGRADALDLLVVQLLLEIRTQKQLRFESREEHDIRKIASCLMSRFQETVTIPELLGGSGLSQRTFYRLWNQFYGESPKEMLQAKRMFTAEQLLTATTLRIQEISELCGFSSPIYFYQQFRKKHGCSPADYRRKNTNISGGSVVSSAAEEADFTPADTDRSAPDSGVRPPKEVVPGAGLKPVPSPKGTEVQNTAERTS